MQLNVGYIDDKLTTVKIILKMKSIKIAQIKIDKQHNI